MGLFDALLSQEGVNLTGGGTVFDPTQDEMEVRFTAEGTPYNARPGTPLHEGHTRANQPMFDLPKSEVPTEPSLLNYGDNYYSGEQFTPQNVSPKAQPTPDLMNQPGVNRVTQEEHDRFNAIHASSNRETRYDGQGNAYQAFPRTPLIEGHRKASSFNIPTSEPTEYLGPIGQSYSQGQGQQIPEGAYGSLGDHQTWSRQQAPTPSFERGGEQFVAKDDRGSMSPWLPQQTDFDDARNLMSSYQGGERIAQRDTGTFQDLTPNADPSQAMEMLAMFKKEGKALTDLQFEKAMGSLGMSDILEEHRSTLNTVDKHYQDSVYGNTDDFGNPLNTDDFGNAHYDQRVDNYVNSLNDMTGINDVERVANVANVAPKTTKPSWVEQNQDITQQSQDFVKNLGSNIADGATDLYEGAKELGSDAYQGAQDLYQDFNKPDTRTQAQKWADAQKISDNLKQGITDTASSAWKGLGDAWNATDKVVTKEMLASKDLIADTYEGLLGSDIEDYKKGSTVGETLLTGVENFAESGAKEIDGLVQAISSPLETADAIGSLISGAVQHALPDDMSWNEDSKNMASAVADIYADRYGSVEGFKKSFAEEPVPVLLELVGAGLITKLAAAKSLSALKGVEMGQAVENFSDKAIEMASLGTIKDGGRMNVVDDGLLGQTPKDPMIVQHNLTAEALAKQAEGGLPMPSVAVSKVDNPMESFGEISLLGHPDMVKPSRSTKTYPSDIYSGRAPHDWNEYSDPSYINAQVGEKTLDWYGIYDIRDSTPGDIETKILTLDKFEQLGYKQKDYENFRDMEWEVNNDLRDKGKDTVSRVYATPEQYLGETKRVMVDPKGMYTPSGNKRDSVPYSSETSFKEMKKRKAHLPGAENFKGAGQTRALSSEPFKNMADIKANRHKIGDPNTVASQKEMFESSYNNVLDRVQKLADAEKKDWYSFDSYDSIIQDAMAGRSLSWTDFPPETIKKIQKLVEPLKRKGRSIGTEYFEAKPNRLVPIEEFKGAIIPDTAKEAQKILEDKGIKKILKYGSDEERAKLFKEFNDLMFAKVAIPAGGLMGGEDFMSVEAEEEIKPPLYTEPEKPMTSLIGDIKAPTKFKPSNDLLDFVKNFENAPLAKSKNGTSKAYKDYDTTSQGFGSEPKKDGSPMTKKEADKAVIVQLIKANKAVDRLVKVDLNEHQRNALVSMLSNVKTAKFAKSNALKALNNGNIKTFLKEAFDPKIGFVKAGGKISNGLVRRRAREKQIFTKGNYGN